MYVVKSQKFCCSPTFFPKTFSGKISIAYLRYKNSNSNKNIIIILILIIVTINFTTLRISVKNSVIFTNF